MMDDDEMHEESPSDRQFVSMVNTTLHNVGVSRTTRVIEWITSILVLLALGALVGGILGACVWIWISAL